MRFAAPLVAAFASMALAAPLFAQGLTIASLKKGMTVSVAGTVERITDEDEFRLQDDSGTIRVYIGPNAMPVAVGDRVTVEGRVDDDIGPIELYAQRLTLADGSVVTLNLAYN